MKLRMKPDLRAMLSMLKETYRGWSEDKASRLAAALSYYTVFSLAPLLVIVIAIAGIVFGAEAVRSQIVAQVDSLVGPEGSGAVRIMMENAAGPGRSAVAAVIGVATLLFGASGVFIQLKDALNTIWEVEPEPGRGIFGMIRDYFFSFSMVLGVGFLLLVSLTVSAALAALGGFIEAALPGNEALLHVINFTISFAVITLLFALIYKIVPDADIAWSDVWIGAAATALLFTIGKYLLGLYLGHSSAGSAYGAAGSLVVLMLWVYYSAQIVLLGAEFTQVYSERYGSRIVPEEGARPATAEERAEQGTPGKKDVRRGAVADGDDGEKRPGLLRRAAREAVRSVLERLQNR